MSRNQKKVFLLVILFVCVCVFVAPHISLADTSPSGSVAGDGSDSIGESYGLIDSIGVFFKGMLYSFVFVPISWIASGAISLFTFAANPDFISGPTGLLNRVAIYELWKFVRDFFNLFFIFSLLLVAFSTVFQLEKFSIKKILLGIVFAAVFVNFSFPVSRFMIDTANVPMYFFAKQMMGSSGANSVGEAFGDAALSSTRIERILFPAKNPHDNSLKFLHDTNWAQLFLAIVFMFLFAISLAVLAIMFVIRLTVLIVLVVFSPIAFVAAAIPIDDLKDYSKKWWTYFNKYLIFGPAAMFMLLVTVRFMSVVSEDAFFKQAEAVAGQVATDGSGPHRLAAQMILFAIPMIMIWMTIGISSYMGIAGASTVEGWGKKVRDWGKRGGFYNNSFTRGISSGLKERAEKNRVVKWVMPKTWSDKSRETEAQWKGYGADGKKGYREAGKEYQRKKVNDAVEEHKKNKTSASSRENDLTSKDSLKSKSAALSLAETKDIDTANRLSGALVAVSDSTEHFKKVVSAADKSSLNMTLDQYNASIAQRDDSGSIMYDASGTIMIDTAKEKILSDRMKKEGKVSVLIEHEKSRNGGSAVAAYQKIVGGMNTKAIAGLDGQVLDDRDFQSYVTSNIARDSEKLEKIIYNEDMSQNNFEKWKNMVPASPSSSGSNADEPVTANTSSSTATAARNSSRQKADEYLRRTNARRGR